MFLRKIKFNTLKRLHSSITPTKPLLYIASRRVVNGIDDALELFNQRLKNFLYLYEGPPLKTSWAQEINHDSIKAVKDKFDTVYVRTDLKDSLLDSKKLFEYLDIIKPKKLIVGYHCHTCKPNEANEYELFQRADELVLINPAAEIYFKEKYPFIENKPIFHLKSQFLPSRKWYGDFQKKIKRKTDPLKISIPGGRNVAFFSKDTDLAKTEIHASRGRYDYYSLLKHLSNQSNTIIYINGSYTGESREKSIEAEQLYKSINSNIHLIGFQNNSEFHHSFKDYHLAVMAAYMPDQAKIPSIETMHYQLRYNSMIHSQVLPLIVKNGSPWLEPEIQETGYGIIAQSTNELENLAQNLSEFELSEKQWNITADKNSLETYIDSLIKFIFE